MKKIKVGKWWLEVPSMIVGAVAVCVLSVLPVVGEGVTKAMNWIRNNVTKIIKGGK